MKKNICLIILIFFLMLTILLNTKCYAAKTSEKIGDAAGKIFGGWGYWETKNANTMMDIDIEIGTTDAINANKSQTGTLVGVFQVIGSVVSVVALIIIGFRYMLSSVEEKAEIKGIIIYYVIGCLLVFATSNLLSVVYGIFQDLEKV